MKEMAKVNEVYGEEKKRRLVTKNRIFVAIVIAISIVGAIYLIASNLEEEFESQEPSFVVINKESIRNPLETQITYRIEVYNQGGEGWGTIHVRYNETEQSSGISNTETKTWQLHLDEQESKIVEFTFNRKSMEAVETTCYSWFTY